MNKPLGDVIYVVTHCHEQVEEQLPPFFHLHLQCPTLFEDLPASDDHRQIMGTQSRVGVRGMIVRISSRSQDHIGRNTALQPLLPQSKLLQVFQAVFLGSAVDHSIPKNKVSDFGMKDCCFTGSATTSLRGILGVLERC